MGINTEMVSVIKYLSQQNLFPKAASIIELGAQTVSAHPSSILELEKQLYGREICQEQVTSSAASFYKRYGIDNYTCIDAGGSSTSGKVIADLNFSIRDQVPNITTFDIVTNLGTSEHCFDQLNVFKNIHDLCKVDGIIIHVLCSQGLVNHGYYNYHPRLIQELALANNYQIIKICFTVDFTPMLIDYTLDNFKQYDDRDIMIYVILKKTTNSHFQLPFDSMFEGENELTSYKTDRSQDKEEYSPYIKTSWSNATAPNAYLRGPSKKRDKVIMNKINSLIFNILKKIKNLQS